MPHPARSPTTERARATRPAKTTDEARPRCRCTPPRAHATAQLRQNTRLMNLLRMPCRLARTKPAGSSECLAHTNWQQDIVDSRNYGYATLTKLLVATRISNSKTRAPCGGRAQQARACSRCSTPANPPRRWRPSTGTPPGLRRWRHWGHRLAAQRAGRRLVADALQCRLVRAGHGARS